MPKEVVQYPQTHHDSGTEISIHWSKEQGHIQLHAERHYWGKLDTTEQTAQSPDQLLQMIGTEIPANDVFWSDPLTRPEINKLIRTLRRARDDAYGADA